MPSYFSYREQSAHYFTRPHDTIPREPLGGPAAWRGREMADSAVWRIRLEDAQVAELDRALAAVHALARPMRELSVADFPLLTLAGQIAVWRDELTQGRGFLVISGLPVERWGQADSELAFWCLGLHLGRPGAQNPEDDLLGHVTDTGADAGDSFVRLYKTASNIRYHCDAADVVGLLCLHQAERGGASRIVSSVSVYNELLAQRPELAERLFEPFLLDIRNEDSSGALRYLPIPPCRAERGRLRTFYHSDYFRSVVRHADVELNPKDLELLDLYEAIASRDDLYLDLILEPGDLQLLSNHTILHARTAYQDYPEPERRRHLLRLWLSIE